MNWPAPATSASSLNKTSVKAGKVTFEVTNDSKTIIHEMILSPVTTGETELPYLADENKVDEDKANHLGEVSELDAGKGGALTVDLAASTMSRNCYPISGHFIDGMWTELTVTQ